MLVPKIEGEQVKPIRGALLREEIFVQKLLVNINWIKCNGQSELSFWAFACHSLKKDWKKVQIET